MTKRPKSTQESEPAVFRFQIPDVIPENEQWLYDSPQTLRDLEEGWAWSLAHPADNSTTEAILKRMAE